MSTSVPLVERLDRLLPQTQCGQCGFDGCRPYADAMARGEAEIDRCPPGGDAGARALAHATGRAPRPYDRGRGLHKPPLVALIVEADCIGCTKCIKACPVDAIIGGAKRMHVVIEPLCTGCELCVPVCPVDCIELLPVAGDARAATSQADASTSPASRNTASASSSPLP
ncbi:Rnf electron transport complex subunit RnfB [Luteimonas yindakuii]|uniref:Rnf electron transport complex subunit RnfB n=1 Tax=Luteimonas yindakuii TaxID=2565782 RepID=A0A4Z1RHU4_9GAMM|nr:Rnf electron transport complex subunit RnfB [Luteimonas yindakuii]